MDLNSTWKTFKREFNSMDIFWDTLYILSKDEESRQLRIPLSTLMDYKGFRWIAIGLIPLKEYSLKLGINSENTFIKDQRLIKEMSEIGEILGLKDVKWIFKGYTVHESIPVSAHIKIYTISQNSIIDNQNIDTKMNVTDEHHFFELQYQFKKGFDIGYVFNTKYIYPLESENHDFSEKIEKYFRIEFMYQYEKPLKADTK